MHHIEKVLCAALIASASGLLPEAALPGVAPPMAAAGRAGPAVTGEPPEVIPAGTRFDVALEQSLGTGSTPTGERWSGILTHAIMDGDRVLVAPGARVTGTVTAAGPLEVNGGIRQVLALEPRELDVNGRSVPIWAGIVHVELPEPDGRTAPGDAAIVGDGAGTATLLGALTGDEGDALLGAVPGGTAATAIAVSLGPSAIEIPRGSRLTLSLEEAVEM